MFREEIPRIVYASSKILCFKIKALFYVGIWATQAGKALPHTNSFTKRASKLASSRISLV